MGDAKDTAVRFYDRFGSGDLAEAFVEFAPDCIALTPSGRLNNEQHLAAARTLKAAIPDGHMDLIRVIEVGDEVYISGWFQRNPRQRLLNPARDESRIRKRCRHVLR